MRILGFVIGETFQAVLAAAQGGDEGAFSALWRDANPALLRYLRVIAPEVAEDVAADSWVHVVRGLDGFRGDEAAWRAWLFTTARRRVIDDARYRARRPASPVAEMPAAATPLSPDTADVVLERLSTSAAIALVAELPRLQAEVILLRVLAGLDNEATAQLLGRSPGAVRVAAHRGLRRLAQLLRWQRCNAMKRPGVSGGGMRHGERGTRSGQPGQDQSGPDQVLEALLAGGPLPDEDQAGLQPVADVLAALRRPAAAGRADRAGQRAGRVPRPAPRRRAPGSAQPRRRGGPVPRPAAPAAARDGLLPPGRRCWPAWRPALTKVTCPARCSSGRTTRSG